MRPLIHLALFAIGTAAFALACAPSRSSEQMRPAPAADPAPDSFTVRFETTEGPFTVQARRHWSPAGVDRFYELLRVRFYDEARFFRVVRDFVVQFGISGDPAVSEVWGRRVIADDPVRASNRRGTVSFARGGPNSRATQLFINLKDNARLDTLSGFGFPPIGEVVQGMEVVDALHGGYGESRPRGRGPVQDSIRLQGNAYLEREFPELDAIRAAVITAEWR